MKTRRLLLVLFLVMIGFGANAQPWAQPGATWYYSYEGLTEMGYHKIEKTNDTLIGGILCDNLLSTFHYFEYMNYTFYTSQHRDHTYISNDTLYYLYNDHFVVMAVFSALSGDKWKVPFDTVDCSNTDSSYMHVDSIGQRIYSGHTLSVFYVTELNNTYIRYSEMLTKRMGYSLVMFPKLDCLLDQPLDNGLRCYSDSSGFSYNSGIVSYCDSTVGINELIQNRKEIIISPNPFTTQATLTFQGVRTYNYMSLHVYNLLGQEVQNIFVGKDKEVIIHRNNLPSGMYFYKLMDDSKTVLGMGKMVIE
ncbi:MAG: T9SS type A sorting domain-containing protein [Bacteroidota bacterium]